MIDIDELERSLQPRNAARLINFESCEGLGATVEYKASGGAGMKCCITQGLRTIPWRGLSEGGREHNEAIYTQLWLGFKMRLNKKQTG